MKPFHSIVGQAAVLERHARPDQRGVRIQRHLHYKHAHVAYTVRVTVARPASTAAAAALRRHGGCNVDWCELAAVVNGEGALLQPAVLGPRADGTRPYADAGDQWHMDELYDELLQTMNFDRACGVASFWDTVSWQ